MKKIVPNKRSSEISDWLLLDKYDSIQLNYAILWNWVILIKVCSIVFKYDLMK